MAKEVCSKCGSKDLMSWGSERRMCNRCGEIFSVEVAEPAREKEESLEYSYKSGEYLEQLRRERERVEAEAKEAMKAVRGTGEAEEVEVEIVEEEPEPEPEALSASAEYEKLHAAHQEKMDEDRAREEQAAAAYKTSHPQRSTSGVDRVASRLENIFSPTPTSKPAARPLPRTPTAAKKKSTTVGCVIAAVVIFIVVLSLICNLVR